MFLFRGNDYKEQFKNETDGIIEDFIVDREIRKRVVNDMIDLYVDRTGERPDSRQLERLASHLMHEELEGDKRPDKMTLEDAPVMTESQKKTRHNAEVGDKQFSFISSDGNNFRRPVSRPKTTTELMAIDADARRIKDERTTKVKAYKAE